MGASPVPMCDTKSVRVCPAEAFNESESHSCTIGGMKNTYATHDDMRCTYGVCGMTKGAGARSEIEIPDGPGQFLVFYADNTVAPNSRKTLNLADKITSARAAMLVTSKTSGKRFVPSPTVCSEMYLGVRLSAHIRYRPD